MAFNIHYSKIFDVSILHHFFLNKGLTAFDHLPPEEKEQILLRYNVSEIFSITPTEQTQKTLNSQGCIFKAHPGGFMVATESIPDASHPGEVSLPQFDFDPGVRLTFVASLLDQNILNYTALPFRLNPDRVWFFTNTQHGAPRVFPHLSSVPPVYENGTEYFPGDMLSDQETTVGTLYTALIKTGGNPATSSHWFSETAGDDVPLYYANSNDQQRLVRSTLVYRMPENDIVPDVKVTDAMGETVEVAVEVFPGEQATLQIDMRHLPEGCYNIHLQNESPAWEESFGFFLLHRKEAPFALFHIAVNANDLNFFSNEGHLLSPRLMLRFRNRMTHWRYVGRNFNLQSFTQQPMPLTRFGFIDNVTVKDLDGEDVSDLPNPGNAPLKAEAFSSEAETRFYSDVHIN